ncbi:Subtilisin-like protease SBT5.4 [Bienertia sinuspersici]
MISNASKWSDNGQMPSEKLIYSYTNIFNAFAATLHEEEADELAKHTNVISIFENSHIMSLTINSWDFLSSFQHQNALTNGTLWEKASHGEDIIIGSFSDKGYGDIPKKFKGQCNNENDPTFKCNRKLIGARYFSEGFCNVLKSNNVPVITKPSPRDMEGHGTHTISIAGGNIVPNAESTSIQLLGFKNATVKGGAPRARVSAYKVLWPEKNEEAMELNLGKGSAMDMLAGFDAAISDGVDIINLSIEGPISQNYFEDVMSIGSFHAMMNGVLVVAGAANSGPSASTVKNIAPWMLTVGASTLGREFTCNVTLGNKHVLDIQEPDETKRAKLNDTTFFPLIAGIDAQVTGSDPTNASYCMPESLDPVKVKGKILICLVANAGNIDERLSKSEIADKVEAVGLILANDENAGSKLLPDASHIIPTAHMTYKDSQPIFSYIKSTRLVCTLFLNFSSRGPNPVTPNILKPDVIAPGSSIMAAFSEAPNATMFPEKFRAQFGTSMAAPHVAAIAALLRKVHPDWSVSAIKSAIMTTARPRDKTEKPLVDDDMVHESTPFSFGAGLVQPNLAMDPGLVYDMNQYDYLNFLCAQHYNATTIKIFSEKHDYKCPESFSLNDFNYPSIVVTEFSESVTVTRKLKNVGQPGTYTARLEAPAEVSIVVEPKTLVFTKKDQEIMFKLIFSTSKASHLSTDYKFGSLIWSDGNHVVRSPIVIKGKDLAQNSASKIP